MKATIKRIQDGNSTPKDEYLVVSEFEKYYVPHIKNNYLYDQEEIKTEYLLACWNAIFRAKINIGNPIMFCVRRGRGAMLDYYRKINSQKLIYICSECGTEYTYDKRNTKCRNSYCKTGHLVSKEKEELVDYIENIPAHLIGHYPSVEEIIFGNEDQLRAKKIIDDIIDHIKQKSKDIRPNYVEMAVEALEYRTDFAEYSKIRGKSVSWSTFFKIYMVEYLNNSNIKLV
jgi:DNA-directed RNA polymerase subunit RPC12/RpoP